MFKKSALLALGMVFGLAACGGGEPSEDDMKAALAAELGKAEAFTGKIEIVSFKKDACAADGQKYRCSFTVEVALKNPLTGEQETNKDSAAGVFEKINDAWTVQQG